MRIGLHITIFFVLHSATGAKSKFKLSENCPHKHELHQLPNLPEILTLSSNHTIYIKKNKPREFKGESRLPKEVKSQITKLIKNASKSCGITKSAKLLAFVTRNGDGEPLQMYLLEHDKKREKRVKLAKQPLLLEISKSKIKGKPTQSSRVTITITLKALDGNIAKLSKKFHPFLLEPTSIDCPAPQLKRSSKVKVEFKIDSFAECHAKGLNFKLFTTDGIREKFIKMGKPDSDPNPKQGECPSDYKDYSSLLSSIQDEINEDNCGSGSTCNNGTVCYNQKIREFKCQCKKNFQGKCCEEYKDEIGQRKDKKTPGTGSSWPGVMLSVFIIAMVLLGFVIHQICTQRRKTHERSIRNKQKKHINSQRRVSGAVSGQTQLSNRTDDVMSNTTSNGIAGYNHEHLNNVGATLKKPNYYQKPYQPNNGISRDIFHHTRSIGESDVTSLPNMSQIQQDSRSRAPVISIDPSDVEDNENML